MKTSLFFMGIAIIILYDIVPIGMMKSHIHSNDLLVYSFECAMNTLSLDRYTDKYLDGY
jgi:hypothetical protein